MTEHLTVLKVILLLCMAASVLLATLAPLVLLRGSRIRSSSSSRIVSCLSMFAGGVFVSIGLLDLFPDAVADLSEAASAYKWSLSEFPLGHFLLLCGFFLVLVLERAFSASCTHSQADECRASGGGGVECQMETLVSTQFCSRQSAIRSLLLVLCMSVHSLFEGLSLGLAEDTGATVSLFAAIMLHKLIVAFSIGVQISQSGLGSCLRVACACVFSLTSPLGVSLGLSLTRIASRRAAALVSGVLQSLSCGTFLYVAFFDILPRELCNSSGTTGKLMALLVGFASVSVYTMACLWLRA